MASQAWPPPAKSSASSNAARRTSSSTSDLILVGFALFGAARTSHSLQLTARNAGALHEPACAVLEANRRRDAVRVRRGAELEISHFGALVPDAHRARAL